VSSIERYGTMIKSPNGFPMQSPSVAVANKQVEIMVRIAAELGMTPSSRSRIRVGDKAPADPFEAFPRAVARATQDDPVTAYAHAVAAGRVLANHLVRLACRRHLEDLSSATARRLRFDSAAARHAIEFFGFLRHSKGEWAGQTFALAPWQAFVVGCLFGWQRSDGLRRFRTAYCAVSRKNGKSTLSAGIGLYLLVADGERGAEVYSAATTRDQARIVFDEAKRMVASSPALMRRVGILINNLHVAASAARFMPLSSDATSMDGLNVHGAIIDELHAHKSRHVVDVLETATGARRQPLLFEITTAGYDRHSICYEHHDYSIKVLESVIQDDSWFAFIAAADESDDWTDPAVWRKANPNFGLSVKADDLARKAEKAIALPGAQNAFRRMHLNEWTEQAERWIDMAAWDACDAPVDLDQLRGRPCFGGLDLSTTTDITALAWVFPPDHDDDLWRVLSATSCPRTISGSAPSATVCPTLCGPLRASSRRPPATSSTTPPSSSGSGATAPSSRFVRSPTTPGTPPTSRCASRRRVLLWSNSARASAPWRRPRASSKS
jgi:phage terminase large subunit-like protein